MKTQEKKAYDHGCGMTHDYGKDERAGHECGHEYKKHGGGFGTTPTSSPQPMKASGQGTSMKIGTHGFGVRPPMPRPKPMGMADSADGMASHTAMHGAGFHGYNI